MSEREEKQDVNEETTAPAQATEPAAQAATTDGAAVTDAPEASGASEPASGAANQAEPKQQEAAKAAAPEPSAPRRVRTKSGKYFPVGVVHIRASFNNTHVSITDPSGALLAWSNAGRCAFKGSRKSTAFAATTVAQDAARQVMAHGMNEVEVRVQGPGAGRESAIRAIQSSGLNVTAIRDVTPVPHNGCRAPKRRRV